MTDQHWEVINFLRDYYNEFQIAPAVRVLTKAIGKKLGAEKGTSQYLYELFPTVPQAGLQDRRPAQADRLRLIPVRNQADGFVDCVSRASPCLGHCLLAAFLVFAPRPDSCPEYPFLSRNSEHP